MTLWIAHKTILMSDFILRMITTILESFLQWTGCVLGRMMLKLARARTLSEKQSCTVGGLFWLAVFIMAVYYLSR
jgi:hypothetical protein